MGPEPTQVFEVRVGDGRGGLDLDRDQVASGFRYDVDLAALVAPPVVQAPVVLLVGQALEQFGVDEALHDPTEGGGVALGAEGPGVEVAQRGHDAGVDHVDLRMADLPPGLPRGPRAQAHDERKAREHLKVLVRRGMLDSQEPA